jgi:hypothetical protein
MTPTAAQPRTPRGTPMRRHARTLVMATALLSPCCLTAQQLSGVEPGHRVRLTLMPDPGTDRVTQIVGTLIRLGPDSIAVYDQERLAVVAAALGAARRLEASRGRPSRAGRGALIGLAAGGIAAGLIVCAAEDCSSSGGDFGGVVVGILGVGGGLAGAGVGALVGAMIRPERWETIPLDPPAPGR